MIRAVQAKQAVWFGLVRLLQAVCVFFCYKGMLQLELDVDVDFST